MGVESVKSSHGTKNSKSLVDDVYVRLKRDIVSTRLLPGTALTEMSLAQSLGTSRTPTREALRRLQKDGLVDIEHGRGARVSQVSFRNAIEVYEIRILVEPNAALQAARQLTLELAERLKKVRDVIADPSLTLDVAERWEIDRQLHDIILETAGNELLRSVVWDLRVRTERAFTYYGAQKDMISTRQEHIELVDTILNCDEENAERLMRQHLINARSRLTSF
jgi:DNA-binding GntR family transcriptional regulator